MMGVPGFDRNSSANSHTEMATDLVNSCGNYISANLYQKASMAMNKLFNSFTPALALA